ncbi:MAG: IS200/IS605 family transposase [Bacilli bacterium]|nr:IS200/IS605 family transposase [Bacilli bacterium]
MELKRNSNAVYLMNYHLILITKYRKKVFINDTIVERTKEIMRKIAKDFDVEIINQECGEDHIHLMISTKPTTDLTKLINILKGHSSRYIRKEFEEELSLVLYGDSFWSDSYYIATAGNVSVDTIYNYIDNQRKKI